PERPDAHTAGVLPAQEHSAAQPDRLLAKRPAQDRRLDSHASMRRSQLRRRPGLCRGQHAGRTATASDMTRPLPPSLASIASCISGYDPAALPVEQARAFIDQLVPRLRATEMLPLRSALGRVLARDTISSLNVPAHDNSAMDGYAVAGAQPSPDADTILQVEGSGMAGEPYAGQAASGQCGRVQTRTVTGAVMPPGLDTVVPQEFVRQEGDRIVVPAGVVQTGDNRRLAGEDLAKGEAALAAGRVLRPADIGMLASLGQAEVPVVRRLRVAFFSTGNELRSIGEPLDEGCVYDSNRYTLHGMLQRLGVDLIDMGVVRDDPQALADAFSAAAANADAVITSGGVSVGEADHTK